MAFDDASALAGLAELQARLDGDGSQLLVAQCSFDGSAARPIIRWAPEVGTTARREFVACLHNLAAGYHIGLRDYRDGVRVRLAELAVDADELFLSFVGSHRLELVVALNGTAAERTGALAFTVADTLVDLAADGTLHRI